VKAAVTFRISFNNTTFAFVAQLTMVSRYSHVGQEAEQNVNVQILAAVFNLMLVAVSDLNPDLYNFHSTIMQYLNLQMFTN
jgi:hypothetical protein